MIQGLRYLKKNYYIFIITNQAGIGKKFIKNDFINLHKNMNEKLKKIIYSLMMFSSLLIILKLKSKNIEKILY